MVKLILKYYEDPEYADVIQLVSDLLRMNKSELIRFSVRLALPRIVEMMGMGDRLHEELRSVMEEEMRRAVEELRRRGWRG